MSNGRTRRELLRSLTGGSLFGLERVAPPEMRLRGHSTNPPLGRPVIPAGREAEVMALLGPLATEPPRPEWRLEKVTVDAERIEYAFAGPSGTARIGLVAHTDDPEGQQAAFAFTTSFRLLLDGSAPEAERAAVGFRVAAEVKARDHGQLWTDPDAG